MSIRVGVAACVPNPIMTEILVGDPLQLLTTALTNTLTKFFSCRGRAGFWVRWGWLTVFGSSW